MRNERELAELIFDKFRASKCKTNEIVMMRNIRFGLIDKLNPKEREIFDAVLNGLIFTEYYTYQSDSPECIRLTEKGYDYIYDEEKIAEMKQKPWVIPSVHETNWDKAYLKLWKTIGPQDTATHYVGGSQFYKLVLELADDIPPSYSQFIEERRQKELSTSRVDYYKDLLNHLDEEKRKEFYVKMQLFLEEGNSSKNISTNEQVFDFSTTVENENPTQTKQNDDVETPTVFISYSWDSPEHEEWIINLATKLCDNGVNAILDKWDLGALGKPLPDFMGKSITKSQRVICIMTPNYKKKTEHPAGGVGYEYSIITSEIFLNGANTSKFIPLFRSGTDADAIPTALKGRKYVDMRNDNEFEEKFLNELLRDIHDEPKFKKPPIGKKPNFGN
jgi:hypothetical protein